VYITVHLTVYNMALDLFLAKNNISVAKLEPLLYDGAVSSRNRPTT